MNASIPRTLNAACNTQSSFPFPVSTVFFRSSLFRHVCGWSSGLISSSPTTDSVLFCIEKKWVESFIYSHLRSPVVKLHIQSGCQHSAGSLGTPSIVAALPCLLAACKLLFKCSERESCWSFPSMENIKTRWLVQREWKAWVVGGQERKWSVRKTSKKGSKRKAPKW